MLTKENGDENATVSVDGHANSDLSVAPEWFAGDIGVFQLSDRVGNHRRAVGDMGNDGAAWIQ